MTSRITHIHGDTANLSLIDDFVKWPCDEDSVSNPGQPRQKRPITWRHTSWRDRARDQGWEGDIVSLWLTPSRGVFSSGASLALPGDVILSSGKHQ